MAGKPVFGKCGFSCPPCHLSTMKDSIIIESDIVSRGFIYRPTGKCVLVFFSMNEDRKEDLQYCRNCKGL